jgi:hypothetical protein
VDYIILAGIIFPARRFLVDGIFSGTTGNSTSYLKKPFQPFWPLAPTERKFQSLGPATFCPIIFSDC